MNYDVFDVLYDVLHCERKKNSGVGHSLIYDLMKQGTQKQM